MLGIFFQSRWFTISAVVVIIFLGISLTRLRPGKIEVENRLENLQDRIAELENSNAELNRLLDYFKSDAYLEKEAKLRLNVKRPDENVVFIYPPEKTPDSSPDSSERSWWSDVRAWLFEIFD